MQGHRPLLTPFRPYFRFLEWGRSKLGNQSTTQPQWLIGTRQVSRAIPSHSPLGCAWERSKLKRSEIPDYNESAFRLALKKIKAITQRASGLIFKETQDLCRQAGVILSFVKPLDKVRLSGAAWWVSPRRPVIQLSARYLSDDHVWFSLFHEAAHILLHSKKQVFVDAILGKADCNGVEESEAESEADSWARNFLVPFPDWKKFSDTFLGGEGAVRLFAEEQGIAPGIIVGRLQREGLLPWNRLNSLKRKLQWSDPAG